MLSSFFNDAFIMLVTYILASYSVCSLKEKKWPGNLPKFKLLTFAALELAVPIIMRTLHVTVVEFQLCHIYIIDIQLALRNIILFELLLLACVQLL